MKKEKCITKFCRGEVAITYLGKPMCQSCFEQLCDEEEERERLLCVLPKTN